MSITVRLIFWGLMGFAPNPEGEKGMTALLVDPDQAQHNVDPKCAVPRHVALVYLLDGNCEGNCTRIPQGRVGDAKIMGFEKNFRGQPLQLAWLLDREDLHITDDEDEKMKFRKPWLPFTSRESPGSKRQSSYFRWVQDLSKLTSGQGFSAECLDGSATCPLHARFKVQGGKAGTCHIIHHLPTTTKETKQIERRLRIFSYTVSGKRPFKRAVADAVLVEFKAEGESVTLTSQELRGQKRMLANAKLRPNADGIVTIVVANFPRSSHHNEDNHNPNLGCAPPHSDILYHLFNPEVARATRKEIKPARPRFANPGSCEREALDLATLLGGSQREAPHSTTACDSGSTVNQ